MLSIYEVNTFTKEEFSHKVGWVFEHTPWIAEQSWEFAPFHSVQQLHRSMVKVVEIAEKEKKLALIQSHPDLGSKLKLSAPSQMEQKQAGLDQLNPREYKKFNALNNKYVKKFGFPFVLAVRGHNKYSIFDAMKRRMKNSDNEEFQTALKEIYKISFFRLRDIVCNEGGYSMENRVMYYGKGDVFVYRTKLQPVIGLKKIPESLITEINNDVFGWNIKMEVGGKELFSSFSEGENELVVATDSMKNFIQKHLAYYQGNTIEGFLKFVSERFLQTYAHIETIKLSAEEVPFLPTVVLENQENKVSSLVFNRSRNEQATSYHHTRKDEQDSIDVINAFSGIKDLQLIKISGNSFSGYIQDEYTTLPESNNRPLFIYLNINWNYVNMQDSYGELPEKYVAAEQVKDIVTSVFHHLETKSIQHLIYQIGLRILARFPQLSKVTFQSQNRTWLTVVDQIEESNSSSKVYTEPQPPFGFQGFTITREDLNHEKLNKGIEEIAQG
ncbi:urate oxidase/2-oxo-4-hydroxy-4-carboxy-5-ureidoimidazoline decarboxylase [Metabacillus crassostreae]|uniref:factor-independent urate hydroxylase n=1 Tax=Metabacillus crassostreae TaxID=929098 RepID=UPI001959AC81|nr:urate oxidase [Metabacillus crassostreae]MBM7603649.1 urate oxidase/2-oxo-4-hydroxy-4-carboxy-5-ureidoimidazoline decarboxylase [Metabacillus crassostreae]